MQPIRTDRKNLVGAIVLGVIVLVLLGVVNFPYRYVEIEGRWVGGAELPVMAGYHAVEMPTMAGWPFRFWIQYGAQETAHTRYWSTLGLFADVTIAFLLAGSMSAFVWLRANRIRQAADRRVAQMAFDAGIAATILLIPAMLLGSLYWETHRHRSLAQRLSSSGNCFMSSWVPRPFAKQLPGGLIQWLARVRHVQTVRCGDETIRSIARLPTLVQLDCYYSEFDSRSIEPLLKRHHLSGLGLTRQSISESDLETISQMRWVNKLSLARTDIDATMLARLQGMDGLKLIDLSDTNIRLSELGKPAWSQSVKELFLTRPNEGESDTLTIDGWPNLRLLSVLRTTTQTNESALTVELNNLPNLESLRLDRLQKHRLSLRRLPLLPMIHDEPPALLSLVDFNVWVPGLSWVESLEIDDLPSLNRLSCFARDLQDLSIRNVPSLRTLEIGSFISSTYGASRPQSADPKRCQAWLDELGRGDGPPRVTLTSLPLEDVDLSGLAKNKRIRHLRLLASRVTFDAVRGIGSMSELETLDLGSCQLKADQLDWFVSQFPKLEALKIDGASLESVDLTRKCQLKRLEINALRQVNDFRLVDQPALNASFRLEHAPQHVEVRDGRSLRGFAIADPWPSTAVFDGLRDLSWFAAGGDAVDDELLGVLLQCIDLDQLTLAYPSISRDGLRQIGRLGKLTVLAVPGADVDDDVTSHWGTINSLWEINLDDTHVGIATIAWLSGIESLRSVSLNRVPMNRPMLESLAELRQASELYLAGVSPRTRDLTPLMLGDSLELLDLSDCEIDEELFEVASRSFVLKRLVLQGCDVDRSLLKSLMAAAQPELVIDIGPIPADFDQEMIAELRHRLGKRTRFTQHHGLNRHRIGDLRIVPNGNPDVVSIELAGTDSQANGTLDLFLYGVGSFATTQQSGIIDLGRFRRNIRTPAADPSGSPGGSSEQNVVTEPRSGKNPNPAEKLPVSTLAKPADPEK